MKTQEVVSVKLMRTAVSASWPSSKLGFCPPTECGTQHLVLLNGTFQRNSSQVLERDASQLQGIHIHNCRQFLVNAVKRIGGQGPVLGVARTNSKFSWHCLVFLRQTF